MFLRRLRRLECRSKRPKTTTTTAWGKRMRPHLSLLLAICALVASATLVDVRADDPKYPDWKGQWLRVRVPGVTGQPGYDPTKQQGRPQQAPLTAEYQAVFEASLADQAAGGQGNDPTYN